MYLRRHSSTHAISDALCTSSSCEVSCIVLYMYIEGNSVTPVHAYTLMLHSFLFVCLYSHVAQLHQVAQSAGLPIPEITIENTPQVGVCVCVCVCVCHKCAFCLTGMCWNSEGGYIQAQRSSLSEPRGCQAECCSHCHD